MKLSYTIHNWSGRDWSAFCAAAEDARMQGVEIDTVQNPIFRRRTSPTNPEMALSARRSMTHRGLDIPVVGTVGDFAAPQAEDEIRAAIRIAADLLVPYVVLSTQCGDADAIADALTPYVAAAEESRRVLLLETSGGLSNTEKMRDVLNRFASDHLAACWNMFDTYFIGEESAEKTITNLGAYVRHVRLTDGTPEEGTPYFTNELVGEGRMPMEDMMNALRSVNYDGYVSCRWEPGWGVEDLDMVLTHFAVTIGRYGNPRRQKKHLYSNKTGTGKFIWKKETLIEKTFSQVLDAMVEEFPDQTAVKYTTLDYTRTYSQFRDDVDQVARALIAVGVKPGDKVAVWATNVPQWYLTFWATTKIGAVLVTVNTAYKIHEAEYLFRQSDTHTLVMIESYRDSPYAEIVGELCPELETAVPGKPLHCKRLPFLRNIVTVGYRQKGCMTWEEFMDKATQTPMEEVHRRAAAVSPYDVANMQYTSGTTGFPKGVMLTHHNIVNNGKNIGDRMDLSTADRMMIQVPMFHCFGMVLAMTASMTHGATILPLPYFSPKPALSCINNERITAFHGVPTMFIAMLEHEDFPKTDFSHMRTGIMAGSPCPIAVMQDVVNKMHMSEITIVYGQTEASPGCTMSSTDDSLEVRVNTVGRPLPEIECKIVDPETGEDLPDNVDGEFVARGYNIMKGYYKMPGATAAAIDKDGWLHTGDLARRDENGNYKITGRIKDMIIRGGENIYPKEIEDFIYTHPKVSDVQVIGVPDEQYGEEIMACVILKEGETMTEDEMKKYVRDHMAKHKVPRYVDFVDAFPMNAAGKILKYKMREDAVKKLNLQKAASIETA